MNKHTQYKWVNRHTLAWLLVAQSVSIAPLFIKLPFWAPLLWLFAVIWRVQIYRGAWPFASTKSKVFLGLLCVTGLLWSYAGTIGVEPLVAFLVVSFVLKLIEVRTRNDVLLIIYVGFIVVAAHFIFFQTMFMALYSCVAIVLLLCAWNCVYRIEPDSISRQLWSSFKLFAQSIPLMLILFIILPRLGTLWHVPIPQSTGITGFSDTMAPGDFSSLSQSREVAFRVSFEQSGSNSSLPTRNQWYWRGLVLDTFDGRRWSHSKRDFFRRAASKSSSPDFWNLKVPLESKLLRYSVLMEPHQQQWLFTLMAPLSAKSSSNTLFFTPGFHTKSARPIASRTQYQVVSSTRYRAAPDGMSDSALRKNLHLPETRNPKTKAMITAWQQQGLNRRELIQKALSMYAKTFTYTLQPPPLGHDSIDEFLFSTQRGFCEHFASSFVVMMRAAGIPARVVVGYQGGEYNEIENYIIVRQSDAHAWAEVWLPGEGWQRVDPTAAVSPLRIEQGFEQSLTLEDRQLVASFLSVGWFNALQLRLDAFSYTWHQWVLGYDPERQAQVFKDLFGGTDSWRVAVFFIVFTCMILFAYYFIFTWKKRKTPSYPEQVLLYKFLKKLEKRGYHLNQGETLVAFATRIGSTKCRWSREMMCVAQLHNKIAYGDKSEYIPELRRRIKAFKAD